MKNEKRKVKNYTILYFSLFIFIFSICYKANAQTNNDIFNGGNDDGFSVICYTQADAVNNDIFNGGNDDGFSVICYVQADAVSNAIFNGGNYGGFSISCIGSWGNEVPLPIELLSFTAECDKGIAQIHWATASETNNNYFTLERSADAINWVIIGTVGEAGNSNTVRNYEFIDSQISNLKSQFFYYRLKQTDFDGKFRYSKIIVISNCGEKITNDFIIYPNPTNGIFNLLFNGDKEQVYSIEIYNILGKKVYYSGCYKSAIDLSDKQSGVYFIHFNLHTKIIIKKIIVEKN